MDTSFITVNCNSSVRIEAEGKVIYVDPYKIEGNPLDADYIFLTHNHYDHFSPEDIKKIQKPQTVYVFPERMIRFMRKLAASGKTFPVIPGNVYNAERLSFETVASYNIFKTFHQRYQGNCGYILYVNGQRVYIAGDMDLIKEARAVKCDIALVPVGGFYTMNYKAAAKLINEIKPKVAIPTHYGKVAGTPMSGEKFAALVDKSIQVDIKLKIMN